MARRKAMTVEEVRTNVLAVFEDCGGPTQVAAACLVTYGAAIAWRKKGALNGAKVETAVRFAKLGRKPVEHFLVDL